MDFVSKIGGDAVSGSKRKNNRHKSLKKSILDSHKSRFGLNSFMAAAIPQGVSTNKAKFLQ